MKNVKGAGIRSSRGAIHATKSTRAASPAYPRSIARRSSTRSRSRRASAVRTAIAARLIASVGRKRTCLYSRAGLIRARRRAARLSALVSESRTHYQISLTAGQAVGLFVGLLAALGLAFFFGLMAGSAGRSEARAAAAPEKDETSAAAR